MVNCPQGSSIWKLRWLLLGVLSTILLTPPAQANRLETFVFNLTENRIEFATDNDIEPKGQVITNPTRLVIDLPGANYKGPTVRRNIGKAIQAVRVGQVAPGTTRLVVEFEPGFQLEAEQLRLKPISSSSRWAVQLPSSAVAAINNSAIFIWPVTGVITAGFGWRIHPISGVRKLHKGIDIAAPLGTPIQAAADGVVTYATWDDGGYGNLVELTHPDGSRTLYAHTNRILVSKGQQVRKGQVIAELGSTGYSTGPHLHFEYQPDGKRAIDPIASLPLRYILFDVAAR